MKITDAHTGLSFAGMFRFVDYYVDKYKRNPSSDILFVLTDFYEIVLKQSKRLVSQRAYCKNAIFDLNRDYAEGYFNKQKHFKTKQ